MTDVSRNKFDRTFMKITIVFLWPVICLFTSNSEANNLYFQKGFAIVRLSESTNRADTIWKSPFRLYDVSVSQDGQFICFTRYENEKVTGRGREVGIFSVKERKISMINSGAGQNFGAVISPNNRLVAFNYNLGHIWKTGIFDRMSESMIYDVDTNFVMDWRSDSLLLFASFDGVIQKNLKDSSTRLYGIPDTNLMGIAIPGIRLLILSDSIYFFQCLNLKTSIGSFEGPPDNVFIVRNGRVTPLIQGKISAEYCYLSTGLLYVQYSDFSSPRKGKEHLLVFDSLHDKRYSIRLLGDLVGVSNE